MEMSFFFFAEKDVDQHRMNAKINSNSLENVEIIHKTKYYYLMAKIEKRFPHPVGFERRKFANGFCFDSVASPMIAL